jgi:hypothetical protein
MSIRFRFRPVADACGAPVLRDQSPDRLAGHGKTDPSLNANSLGWFGWLGVVCDVVGVGR